MEVIQWCSDLQICIRDWSTKLPSPSTAAEYKNPSSSFCSQAASVMYGTLGVYCYLYLFFGKSKSPGMGLQCDVSFCWAILWLVEFNFHFRKDPFNDGRFIAGRHRKLPVIFQPNSLSFHTELGPASRLELFQDFLQRFSFFFKVKAQWMMAGNFVGLFSFCGVWAEWSYCFFSSASDFFGRI